MTDLGGRNGPSGRGTLRVPRSVRASAGRITWGLADQAVSSLTNFVVSAIVARSLGAAGFGMFTLAWVTYGVVLTVSRGLATDPLVVRFSGVATGPWRQAVGRSSGTALLVGLLTGALSVLAGIMVGGQIGAAFIALGLVLPALLVQESWRFAFFAAGDGRKAFTNDVVWAVSLVPAMFIAGNGGQVFDYVLAWGLAGAVAAAYGLVQTRTLPQLAGVRAWLHQQRDLGPRYLAENASNSGGAELRMYGLGAIAGLTDVGAVRGAQLLLGPMLAVLMGLSIVAVAEAARILRRSRRRLSQFCLLLGGGLASAALAWGLAVQLLLPDAVGEFVLGDVWRSAEPLILPTTIAVTAAGFQAGATAGLRALGAARRSLRAQVLASAAFVTGGLAGAAVAGAVGSAWGVAVALPLGAAVWWWELRAGLRAYDLSQRSGAVGVASTEVDQRR